MNTRKIWLWAVLAAVLLAVLWTVNYLNKNTDRLVEQGLENKGVAVGELPKADDQKSAEESKADLIVLDSPVSGATITSPLTLTGKARGYWYFEASFPIELRDAQGNVVASAVAQADGDWMTEDFVNFTATLNFTPIGNQPGLLVLKKDNPSGEPALDDQLEIPVLY